MPRLRSQPCHARPEGGGVGWLFQTRPLRWPCGWPRESAPSSTRLRARRCTSRPHRPHRSPTPLTPTHTHSHPPPLTASPHRWQQNLQRLAGKVASGGADSGYATPFPWQLEAGDKLKPILLVVGGGTALSIPFYFVRHSLRTRSPSSLTRPAAPPLAAAPYRRPPRPQPRAPASLSALPRTPGGWRGRVAFPDAAPPMAMRVAKRVCA